MEYQTRAQSSPAIDAGLRQYMLSVYNYMASGLALTGLVAFMLYQMVGGNDIQVVNGVMYNLNSLGQTIYSGPLMWIIALSPLAVVMYMSFGIRGMSAARAQTMFWVFSFLMGLSLSSVSYTHLTLPTKA